jgi:hypothetical protein
MNKALWTEINDVVPANDNTNIKQVVYFYDEKTYNTRVGATADLNVGTTTMDFDVTNNTMTGFYNGPAQGLQIVGNNTGGLTQAITDAALAKYLAENGSRILENLVVAGEFTSLGEKAIYQKKNLKSIIFHEDSQITGPVGSHVFSDCKKMEILVLPPRLKTISNRMLYRCNNLKTLLIPHTVTTIGSHVFSRLYEIETLNIPANVRLIPAGFLFACRKLRTLTFSSGSQCSSFESANSFQECPVLENIEFPDSLTSILSPDDNIASNMFNEPTTNIRTLKMNRVLWTDFLGAVVPVNADPEIDQVVYFYDDQTFNTRIGDTADLNVGSTVTYNIDGTLSGFYNGEAIQIAGTGPLTRDFVTAFTKKHGSRPLSVEFGTTVTSVADSTFSGVSQLTSVLFKNGSQVTSIGDSVFKDCTTLEKLVFPKGLTSLGTTTFEGCTSLQSVRFPSSLISISGTETFSGATSIQNIRAQKSLWKTAIQTSLVQNPDFNQLVQFYGDPVIVEELEKQMANSNELERSGFQDVLDFNNNKASHLIDYDTNDFPTLVETDGTGLDFDVESNTLLSSGSGIYDGILTIVNGTGQLNQTMVNAAVSAHTAVHNGLVPLHTLVVGPTFASLDPELSLQGTGIKELVFPADSSITTTGTFVLSIDSDSSGPIVLPRWVVQQGPWSLN